MAADKKALASIEETLHDGEKIIATLRAVLSVSNSSNANPSGLLALTGERVIFAGAVRRTVTVLAHPLTDVRSIEFERSVLISFLRLRTGDAVDPTVSTFRPDSGKAQAFVDTVTVAVARAQAAVVPAATAEDPTTPAPTASDPTAPDAAEAGRSTSTADALATIAELHDRGALTDEEFAAAKAKILRA